MTNHLATARETLLEQMKELDWLAKQTLQDLASVVGTERVASWKACIAALIAETLGQEANQEFATIHPRLPSANDIVEEFPDLVDCYRTPLTASATKLLQDPHPLSGR